jgi:hypothetical protein
VVVIFNAAVPDFPEPFKLPKSHSAPLGNPLHEN